MSRSIENLLAKVRGLTVEGASGWMWTSNYAYPPATITGSVKGDLFAIPECLGVKIAMGDHRSSFPTDQEVLRLLSEIRVAGMLTGKTGFLHVHCGDWGDAIFDPLEAAIPKGIPAKHMRPTHVARHPQVFERACRFAKMGGFIDITTGGGCWMGSAADALIAALEKDVPLDRITFSSDGQGSMPRFNEAGEMVGFGVGSIDCDLEAVRSTAEKIGLDKALRPMTATIADALGKPLNALHVASDFLARHGENYDFRGELLGDKAATVVFDNSKIKRLVPDFICTTSMADGLRQAVQYMLSHPETQTPDPEFDSWCDRIADAMCAADRAFESK